MSGLAVERPLHSSTTISTSSRTGAFVQPSSIAINTDDDFDPFRVGEVAMTTTTATTTTPKKISEAAAASVVDNNKFHHSVQNRSKTSTHSTNTHRTKAPTTTTTTTTPAAPLPPRLLVTFKVHEEISSFASLTEDMEGASKVYVKGTLMAQVVSSDARKNVPFLLLATTSSRPLSEQPVTFVPNKVYGKPYQIKTSKPNQDLLLLGNHHHPTPIQATVISIPKDVLSFVNLGTYHMKETVEHMPLLLEQKVVRSKNKIQIAIQVRSKLSNPDDLSSFIVAVSIPGRVNGNSVRVISGDGEWDRWKRVITWHVEHLPRGQSFMVSAKCQLQDEANNQMGARLGLNVRDDDHNENGDDLRRSPSAGTRTKRDGSSNAGLKFPVLLRCQASDKVSTARFHAVEASGHPATVSSSNVGQTFRMVHRLL